MARQESGLWKNDETGLSPSKKFGPQASKHGQPARGKEGLWEDTRPAADYSRKASSGSTGGGSQKNPPDERVRIDDAKGIRIGDNDSDDQSSS